VGKQKKKKPTKMSRPVKDKAIGFVVWGNGSHSQTHTFFKSPAKQWKFPCAQTEKTGGVLFKGLHSRHVLRTGGVIVNHEKKAGTFQGERPENTLK